MSTCLADPAEYPPTPYEPTTEVEAMTHNGKGHLEVEDRGTVLIVRVDGGPHGVFGADIAEQLEKLVDRVDRDPGVHAVVFTGAHPERFVSHAEVRWLQEGGAAVPPVGRRGASAVVRTAKNAGRARFLEPVVRRTPLWPAVQLERLHATFLRMNRSGVIFVAALNGSALGLGAEFAWANDLRVMADGDFFIGQPEVLLGIMPGGGSSQRLTRLIGTHKSLVAILEGTPFTPAQALANGAVDDVVPRDQVVARATELAEHFGSRSKGSVAAIKRAVYFGGSMSLTDGLHVERTEFLTRALSKDGQELMLDYMATTDATGELPLYNPETYKQALESGSVPGHRTAKGR
jgi:enoyl-CoA hydratase